MGLKGEVECCFIDGLMCLLGIFLLSPLIVVVVVALMIELEFILVFRVLHETLGSKFFFLFAIISFASETVAFVNSSEDMFFKFFLNLKL